MTVSGSLSAMGMRELRTTLRAVVQRVEEGAPVVVLKDGHQPSPALAHELQEFVKKSTAPYKYPRWIDFVDALPKTATGKIKRYVLRERASGRMPALQDRTTLERQ